MRSSRRLVLCCVAFAFAVPLGVGCKGGGIDSTTGTGGSTDFSTGDVSELDGSQGFSSSTGLNTPGVWLDHYGDLEDQHASAVGVNSKGEIGVVGTVKGTIDFGNIPWTGTEKDTDLVVAELSTDGQSQWSRRFGDTCDQRGAAVAVSSAGNLVVAGDFCGTMDFGATTVAAKNGDIDAFVAVLDTLGEDVYSRSFGGAGAQIARGVAVDEMGNAVLVGSFDQAFDDGTGTGSVSSTGMDDAFVVKLDPKGNVLWSLTFGGSQPDLARSVALDAAGNVVVGGTFEGSVDFGGGLLTASPGHSSGFVLELDPSGKHLWSQTFDADGDTVVTGVAADTTGSVAATGYFKGTGDLGGGPFTSAGGDDVFVTMMDGLGTRAWSRTFGGPETQRATGITFGVKGEVTISGTSDESIDLGKLGPGITLTAPFTSYGLNMLYAVRYDATGLPVVAHFVDSAQPIESAGVGVDEKQATVFAGSFQEQIGFQFTPITSAGGWDLFVVRDF